MAGSPKRASSGAKTPPGAGPSEPMTSEPASPRASARQRVERAVGVHEQPSRVDQQRLAGRA